MTSNDTALVNEKRHVLDLGDAESARHEAVIEREQTWELTNIGFERVFVTCACGQTWSGEYEIGYFDATDNDADDDKPHLARWEAHVHEQWILAPPEDGSAPPHEEVCSGCPDPWCPVAAENQAQEETAIAPISAEVLRREAAEDRADNLADDLLEVRADLAKANALIDSDELHEVCVADVEAAKADARIARRQLACALVIAVIAMLVAAAAVWTR